MPTKRNKAGQQQNYVPAGNGDASGEYGNHTGSNKHFTNFKKTETAFESFNKQRIGNKLSSQTQPLQEPQPTIKTGSQMVQDWEKNLMTTERVGNPPEKLQTRVEETPIAKITDEDIEFTKRKYSPETVDKAAELIRKYEPSVDQTATDLQNIADSTNGLMAGIGFRLKRLSSLSRKLESEVIEQHSKGNKDFNLDNAIENMKDVARFTMVFDENNFEGNVKNAMDQLAKNGYKLVRAKNTFTEGASYKGLNCNFLDKQGNIFELQFHIPKSMKIKEGLEIDMANKSVISNRRNITSHDIYETTRLIEDKMKENTATPEEIDFYNELTSINKKRWSAVPNFSFMFLN